MSETPRTDAVVDTPIMGAEMTPHKWDKLTELARQLERELALWKHCHGVTADALQAAQSASEAPRWRGVMLDLIALAEVSMRQANRDGGEYLIEEELRPARELLNRTDRRGN